MRKEDSTTAPALDHKAHHPSAQLADYLDARRPPHLDRLLFSSGLMLFQLLCKFLRDRKHLTRTVLDYQEPLECDRSMRLLPLHSHHTFTLLDTNDRLLRRLALRT
jgi:hypothetical protein